VGEKKRRKESTEWTGKPNIFQVGAHAALMPLPTLQLQIIAE